MANETNDTVTLASSLTFVVSERINAFAILIENFIVALCLFTHRKHFSKQEFWLFLVSLNINDIFVGLTMIMLSFINNEVFNNLNACTVLWVCVMASQLSFMYNVLGICVYRFLFILHAGRHRFAWKSNMTGIQLFTCFVIAILYSSGAFFILAKPGDTLAGCAIDDLLGKNIQIVGIYLSIGLLAPLLCTDALYLILFCKIRGVSKRQSSQYSNSRNKLIGKCDQLRYENQNTLFDENIPTQSDCHCQSRATSDINSINAEEWTSRGEKNRSKWTKLKMHTCKKDEFQNVSKDCNYDKIGQNHKAICFKGSKCKCTESKYGCKYAGSSESKHTTRHETNHPIIEKEVAWNHLGTPEANQRNVKLADGLIMRTYFNRVNIFYGGRSRDNQKQSIHLIGVILVVLNLTVFLPTCIKLAAVLVPFNLSSMETELLFILMMNNALLNPWVYTLQSTDFRRAVKDNWLKIYRRVKFNHCVFSR